MDMWIGQCASDVNEMPTSVQKDDEQHNIQDIQHNSPPSITKDEKKI